MISTKLIKNQLKNKFTIEEDQKLIKLIKKYGNSNWELISQKMDTRNPRQCKERWENYLLEGINRSPFTLAEDILLLNKFQELGSKWVLISKFFNSRTDIIIKNRYMVLKRRKITIDILTESLKFQEKSKKLLNNNFIIKKLSNFVENEENFYWDFSNTNTILEF